jgi:hypothetical protein
LWIKTDFTFLISEKLLNLRRKNKTLNNRNTSLISSGELKLCKQKQVVPALRTLGEKYRFDIKSFS